MDHILNRDEAPLTAEEWASIDHTVEAAARRQLVGRRFIDVAGPYGLAALSVTSYSYAGLGRGLAELSVIPAEDPAPVRPGATHNIVFPFLYRDFWLFLRDVEARRRFGQPLELSAAAVAAVQVARREDDLILRGSPELGHAGLLTVDGRQTLPLGDWSQAGLAFDDAVAAMRLLVAEGFYGPFALVASPTNYARMARVFDNSGVLEIDQVRNIMTAGVFQTPLLDDGVALVVATGRENLTLLVGQDLVTAYLTESELNHPFRVMETVALNIQRPGAVCTLEAEGQSGQRRWRRAGEKAEPE